eukprot:3842558-Pyramimonas_sp.AAC.1
MPLGCVMALLWGAVERVGRHLERPWGFLDHLGRHLRLSQAIWGPHWATLDVLTGRVAPAPNLG